MASFETVLKLSEVCHCKVFTVETRRAVDPCFDMPFFEGASSNGRQDLTLVFHTSQSHEIETRAQEKCNPALQKYTLHLGDLFVALEREICVLLGRPRQEKLPFTLAS